MCLIAFALTTDPACPLLVASNRDEFLDRPTAPLHRWQLDDGTEVVGGRDLRDGGTWLALSPQGRLAMLTNVRQPPQRAALRSRGELVTRWLQHAGDAQHFARQLDPAEHGAFNLVVGDFKAGDWRWISNRDPAAPHADPMDRPPQLHQRPLSSGLYGLSNASLDTPWPKTQRLKAALGDALQRLGRGADQDWMAPLSSALTHDQPTPDAQLPRTGVPEGLERALSSPFVRTTDGAYGTRTSQVLRVQARAGGFEVTLDEWTHDPGRAVGALLPAQARRETLLW